MADTKLTALAFGSTPALVYGEEGGVSKKYSGMGFYNVKDFGALGDNSHDDTSAIQAAINAASSQAFGGAPWFATVLWSSVVFFPPGTYKITSSLTYNSNTFCSIVFLGCGVASTIYGSFTDYLIKRAPSAGNSANFIVEKLALVNGNTTAGGCVYATQSTGVIISDCYLNGFIDAFFDLSTFGCSVRNTIFRSNTSRATGSIGILTTADVLTVTGCDFQGFDNGIRAYGVGLSAVGGRFEVCNVGIMLGRDNTNANSPASNNLITGMSFEGNLVGIQLNWANNFNITAVSIQGSTAISQSTHGLLIGPAATDGVIQGVSLGGTFSTSAVLVSAAGGQLTFISVVPANTFGGGSTVWTFPSDSNGINCINCAGNPIPACTVAQAPTNPGIGQTQWFSNSNTATFRATIAGGGANVVLGMWNGTNWTVAG